MKTFTLLAAFLLIISCNSSTEQKTQPILNPAQTPITPSEVVEKELKDPILKDSLKNISPKELSSTPPPSKKDSEKDSAKEISAPIKKPITKAIPETKKTEAIVVTKKAKKEVSNTTEKQEPVKASHDVWNQLTKTYVSVNGKVNYAGLKGQISTITDYLLHLQNTPPTKDWSKNEKLAYWFNLYNASTVHLVATNYPIKSIKDINGGKPWDKKFIKSGSKIYSLNDIENTIVRPNYNEPRLHVAFNCAAVSCPNLLNAAFSPSKLNSQLNSLSKKWLNDASKNKLSADKIEISQIFNWYKVDFKEGVIPFINKHSNVKVNPNAEVTYMEYNWALNE